MLQKAKTFLPALLVIAAILAAWSNTIDAPLVFDDLGSIRDNPSIRPPYSLHSLLNPPSEGGQTVAGRPLLNLSFALDQFIWGNAYSGYRVTNILIHALNALLLLSLAHLTLRLLPAAQQKNLKYLPLSLALLWSLHPIATSAVTYLAQRAESLVALFLLATLYTFARSLHSSRPIPWRILSLLLCFAGTACKEVMVAAPLIVALYAWTFQKNAPTDPPPHFNKSYFALLFSSWIPLLLLTASTGNRGGTTSLSIGLDSFAYLKTQAWVIVHYLKTSFWPHPLVFDYGRDFTVHSPLVWIPYGLLLIAALILSLRLVWKRSPLGFLALSAFLVLAPTSSIFPLADPAFLHRFYLPLISVTIFSILALQSILKNKALFVCLALAPILAFATYQRNRDFQSPTTLWQQSLAFEPQNARAHTNLGTLYLEQQKTDLALEHLQTANAIHPTPLRQHNLANALAIAGQTDNAIPYYQATLATEPNFQPARLGLADAYLANDQPTLAIPLYQTLVETNPSRRETYRQLARAQLAAQLSDNAIETLQTLCSLAPKDAAAHFDLGDALARSQKFPAAKQAFLTAAELDPKNSQTHTNLGNIALFEKDFAAAKRHYQTAIAIQPDALTHANLGIAYLYTKNASQAKTELRKALELDPTYRPATELLNSLEKR